MGASANLGGNAEETTEVRREVAERYQRIVNEVQLPRLNQVILILADNILDSRQHATYLLIDDLDRDWTDDQTSIVLIRCLLRAVLDMQRIQPLKILVALRSNLFDQLQFGTAAGSGQEEKYRALAMTIEWSSRDLEDLLNQRALVASEVFGMQPPRGLGELLPATTKGKGSAVDYIVDRTLMRPRDAIMFLNIAAEESTGKSQLDWDALSHAEAPYSKDRLRALRDEWKSPYFGIDEVFEAFRRAPEEMDKADLSGILDRVAMALFEGGALGGSVWLTELCDQLWTGSVGSSHWADDYGPLTRLLYNIGFLGIADDFGRVPLFSYDRPGLADDGNVLESGVFVVHRAFRPALEIHPA